VCQVPASRLSGGINHIREIDEQEIFAMHSAAADSSQGWVRRSLDLIARARLALKEGRDRRLLEALNDHMLADIGLTRIDLGCGAIDRSGERL
jgi:uncharacterized protein YjiS (DUF1127 family)